MHQTDDLRISAIKELSSPITVHEEYPLTEQAAATVHDARESIYRRMRKEDDRLL